MFGISVGYWLFKYVIYLIMCILYFQNGYNALGGFQVAEVATVYNLAHICMLLKSQYVALSVFIKCSS